MEKMTAQRSKRALWAGLLLGMGAILTVPVSGQQPVVPNSWNNPQFQARVLGSFGVRSGVEPEPFERDEARFFNENILPVVQAGETAQAIQVIESNLTAESNPNLDYILGTLYLQQGNFERAVRSYRQAVEKFPEFLRAHKNLGIALTQMGEAEAAIASLALSIEYGDSSGDTFGLLAYNYFNTGEYNRALDAYRVATVLDPKNKDWMIGKTQSLMEIGAYAEATQSAMELLEIDPLSASLWLTRANARIGLEDFEGAILSLEMARLLGDPPLRSLILLADLYVNNGVPQLAVDVYTDALGKGMDSSTALRVVRFFIAQGQMEEAKRFVNHPDFSSADWSGAEQEQLLVLRSRMLLADGDESEAMTLLSEVVERNPLNAQALLQLGDYHRRGGDTEQAIFYYDRIIALSAIEQRFEGLVQKATLLVELQQYREARDLVRTAMGIRSEGRLESYLEALDRIVLREGL